MNRLRTFRTSHRAAAFVIAVAGLGLLSTSIAPAQTAASDRPLVLAIDHGRYIEFDRSTGQSLGPVDSGSGSESTGGCAFGNGLFYSLGWDSRSLTAMKSGAPHDVVASVVGPWWLPETIAVAASGDLWVATGDTQNVLYRVDPKTLKVADVLNPALDGRGVWLDLAADQRTMFYTAEGHTVKRYDVVSKKQLPDFAQLPDTTRAYQIALLGPRDGSGGAVVAGKDFVYRLNASGAVVQTYSIEHEPNWIGVLPDPNGTSLWGVDQQRNRLVRWNIATGDTEIGPVDIPGARPADLCIAPDPSLAQPSPPAAAASVTTGSTSQIQPFPSVKIKNVGLAKRAPTRTTTKAAKLRTTTSKPRIR